MSIPVFILKRLLQAVPLLFIISVMSFTMLKMAPIDPLAHLRANPAISLAAIKAEEHRLGLDKPAPMQYFIWLTNTLEGDLGISTTGAPVAVLLVQRAGNTLLLGVLTLIFTWAIAVPAGVVAAVEQGKLADKFFSILTSIGMSMPTFLLALLLLMGALATHLLPIGGLTSPEFYERSFFGQLGDLSLHLIIPVTVLTIVGLAAIQRQMRGNLLDVLRAEYVRTARAKGLPESKVIYHHAPAQRDQSADHVLRF